MIVNVLKNDFYILHFIFHLEKKDDDKDDKDGLSTGELIGIIVACVLVLIIIIIIIVHVSKSRGKGNINKFQNGGPDPNAYGNSAYEMDHKY